MKSITAAIALLLANTAPATAQDTTLYLGGPIITMDGDTPQTVEAVVTKGDRIAFAGSEKQARAAAGDGAVVHDLNGATMLPGFIDAHSHFTVATLTAGGLDLRAGAPVTDVAGVIARSATISPAPRPSPDAGRPSGSSTTRRSPKNAISPAPNST